MRAHLPLFGLRAAFSAAALLLLTACGEGPAGTVARERFEGRFAAFVSGKRLDFTLTEQGSEVRVLSTGTPAVGRRTAPGLVTGRLEDASGESEFELEMKQGRLAVRFVVIAGDGSRERLPEVLLERLPDDLETAPRDPALVGAWVDREVGSAPAGGAHVTRLELRADGSYDLRRDAQDAEPQVTGRWKAEQQALWLMSMRETRWREVGRYELREGRLTLATPDLRTETWVRPPAPR